MIWKWKRIWGLTLFKQATIFSILGEKFNLGDKNANISQYKTIGSIVDLVSQSAGKGLKETADLGGETYSSNVVNNIVNFEKTG